jgi:hypothetical protein
MAIWYVDSRISLFDESDSFDGGYGVGKLRKELQGLVHVAGDKIFGHRAAPSLVTSTYLLLGRVAATDTYTELGAYGATDNRYYIVDVVNGGGSGGVLGIYTNSGTRYNARISDVWARNAADSTTGAAFTLAATAGDLYGAQVLRCKATGGVITGAVADNYGISVQAESTGTYVNYQALVQECIVSDVPGHGISLQGNVRNSIVRRNAVSRNGYGSWSHGITAYAHRTVLTSGWTNTSSTIYSHAITPPQVVYQVKTSSVTYTKLVQNTATPTLPALGEFGFAANTLYINIGVDPTGSSVTYAYGETKQNLIDSNECSFVVQYRPASTWEAVGIQMDDFAASNIVRANHVHDNEGRGLGVNAGNGNTLYGNVSRNNGAEGLRVQAAFNTIVEDNTFLSNNTGTLGLASGVQVQNFEVLFDNQSPNSQANRNIVVASGGNTLNGIVFRTTSQPGSSASKNNVIVSGVQVSGVTDAGVTATAPAFNGGYMPLATGLRSSGTATGRSDFYGKENRGTIGAVQYQPVRAVSSRRAVTA